MIHTLKDLDRFPPTLCRAVARTHRGRRSMSHNDLAKRSGLQRSTVVKLSRKTSWKNITLDTIIRFSEACGVNLLKPRRQLEYLGRRKKIAFGPLQERLLRLTVAARTAPLQAHRQPAGATPASAGDAVQFLCAPAR